MSERREFGGLAAELMWVAVWEAEEHAPPEYEGVVERLRTMARMVGPEPERPQGWEYDLLLREVRSAMGAEWRPWES